MRFQTQEVETESEATSTGQVLAARGLVVRVFEHDHDTRTYREVGMFVGERFIPVRSDPSHPREPHRLG